ncbi:hypothetical protein ACFQ73_02185 [Amycolatopsis japonica]|uniref:hypothetical protein n=1 Tax=Amycolatopsis japonica TaxID=208439 RepID=UPI00367052DC
MLRTDHPRDLDVLIIYTDPQHVTDLYAAHLWEVSLPLLDFIAMTPDEEDDYRFIQVTNAALLHSQPSSPAQHPSSQNCKTS